METFTQAFQNDLEKEEQILKQIPRSNLLKKEKDALKALLERNDTIILKAHKGGAVVINDVDDDVKESICQLENTKFYKKLRNDTTELNWTKLNTSIEELQALVRSLGWKNSYPKTFRSKNTAIQAASKKFTKKRNPSRPVVSSVDWQTTKISKYIDQTTC